MQWGLRASLTVAALAAAAVAIGPHDAWAETAGAGDLIARAGALLREGYAKAPALMIGLGALLLIPPLALTGLLLRRSQQQRAATALASDPDWVDDPGATTAFVEVEVASDEPRRRAVDRELLQIGRQDDNDICLDESTVHRYHAIIERSWEHGLIITDVSGPEGNGIKLNGEKISRAGLVDGDVVELGAARLRVVIPKHASTGVMETKAA